MSSADYLPSRAQPRTRPNYGAAVGGSNSPRTPRTPILGHSLSSQFGSPGTFRVEQEDVVVYELDPRFLSAGYAGESRPRCILRFTPEGSQRNGDHRQYEADHAACNRPFRLKLECAHDYELYRSDLAGLDLGLVDDKLERAVRKIHSDHLQLDSKARKAILVVPPSTPTPMLELALKVLFGHFTQPPSICLMTSPVLSCASAGLRNALVVDIGWEETTVTAVGEYKEISQRRSIRAGKALTREMAAMVDGELAQSGQKLTFDEAESLVQRVAWCRTRQDATAPGGEDHEIQLPLPGAGPSQRFPLRFAKLAAPAEKTFFAAGTSSDHDDHDLPLHLLAHQVLLSLPMDFRSTCVSRIVLTGSYSRIPGIKGRLLHELSEVIEHRGWGLVRNYGSVSGARTVERKLPQPQPSLQYTEPSRSPAEPSQDDTSLVASTIRAADRDHDDLHDPITLKAERGQRSSRKNDDPEYTVRGVESLGAWAGASLMASLRVRGMHEIERDDFLKHGLRGIDL